MKLGRVQAHTPFGKLNLVLLPQPYDPPWATDVEKSGRIRPGGRAYGEEVEMSETCPHCGDRLPIVQNAFCSSCRQPLDEPPSPETKRAAKVASTPVSGRVILFRTAACASLLLAVGLMSRGAIFDAAVSLVAGLTALGFATDGPSLPRFRRRPQDVSAREAQYDREATEAPGARP